MWVLKRKGNGREAMVEEEVLGRKASSFLRFFFLAHSLLLLLDGEQYLCFDLFSWSIVFIRICIFSSVFYELLWIMVGCFFFSCWG